MVLRPAVIGGPGRFPPPSEGGTGSGSLTELVQPAGHLWVQVRDLSDYRTPLG